MAREFARAFYHSPAWERARSAAIARAHGLCERCLEQGIYTPCAIVHHRVHLTPDNICDSSVTTDLRNLECVCRDCHAAEHPEIYGDRPNVRVAFDEFGNVVRRSIDDKGQG